MPTKNTKKDVATAVSHETGELRSVALATIMSNPWQPRLTFSEVEMQELTASIQAQGILQPPVVRPHPLRNMEYELIAGERRCRAAGRAGLQHIQVIVRAASNEQMSDLAIAENTERADVNAIEEALAWKRHMVEFNTAVAVMATKAGKSRPVISNALRLLDLPDATREMIADGQLSAAHGRALARWSKFPKWVNWYADQIVRCNIPTRVVERGYHTGSIDWNDRHRAENAGVYVEIETWRYRDVLADWIKARPEVFIEQFSSYESGNSNKRCICLDCDYFDTLVAEYQKANPPTFNYGGGDGLSDEERAEQVKAQRREKVEQNKKLRAELMHAGAQIQAKVGHSYEECRTPATVEASFALFAEIIVNALSGMGNRFDDTISDLAKLRGVDEAWVTKFNDPKSHSARRTMLIALADERGLIFCTAFWGEVLLMRELNSCIKDAWRLPDSCKHFAKATGIGIGIDIKGDDIKGGDE